MAACSLDRRIVRVTVDGEEAGPDSPVVEPSFVTNVHKSHSQMTSVVKPCLVLAAVDCCMDPLDELGLMLPEHISDRYCLRTSQTRTAGDRHYDRRHGHGYKSQTEDERVDRR